MLLVNYIDRYKEKMGIEGSASHARSQVERVLNFVNKKRGRSAADQVIDFESFKQAKLLMQTKHTVKSSLRASCQKRGFPEKFIEAIPDEEISVRCMQKNLDESKKLRNVNKKILSSFKVEPPNRHRPKKVTLDGHGSLRPVKKKK